MNKPDHIGREVIIPENALIHRNPSGYAVQYFLPTVEVIIAIGENNTATLIMSEPAYEALKKGEKIIIDEGIAIK